MAAPAPGRPDLFVVLRLLDRLSKADGPMLRTRLQLSASLNYDIFSKYLAWLDEKGLVVFVSVEDGREGVVLTAKGREAFAALAGWIDKFVHAEGAPPSTTPPDRRAP